MAEKALTNKTNLQSRGPYQGGNNNRVPGPTKKSNASSVSKVHEDKSVRPKEKVDSKKITKSSSPVMTHHIGPKDITGHFGKRQDGRHQHRQGGQRQPSGSRAEGRPHFSKTPSKNRSRGRAVEIEGCGTSVDANHQPSQRGSRLVFPPGSKDNRMFQPISLKFLNQLLRMEPSEAAIQLGSLKGSFMAGLDEENMDAYKQRLFWDVLAHISDNVGVASTVIMLLTVAVGSRLLNTHLPLRLIHLRERAHQGGTRDCLGFIAVLVTVFESMISCIPSRAAEIKVPLVLMTDVVNAMDEESTQDVKPSLVALVQYIESVEAEKEFTRQKHRNASSKPPPDDFRQQSILPTYQELTPSYRPYLRPHIVNGAYPNADHYFDVHFRLMKEDFIQPLRSGLGEYLHNKQVRPENRVKVNDIRVYENVELVRPKTDNSGVSYLMSFKRLPHVRWEMSKRLIYGSLVLLSEDEFKTYIPATVANSEAKQLARGLVDLRPIDTGMSSIVDKTFVMVESTVFFEAYRHVLVGLQRVSPATFPMAEHILDLKPDIKPPAYLMQLSHPKLDVSNLMIDRNQRNNARDISMTKLQKAASRVQSQHKRSPKHVGLKQHEIDTPFPISVLNGGAWPAAEETNLNPSQLEAVKVALTQELSLIQGPPGTGKTYIGLKIVETLLKNMHCWSDEETGPILLVCYTNHALDQFLLGIMKFQDTGIIRVGSRSKCIELEPHNLKQVIREQRFKKNMSNKYIKRRAGNVRQETTSAKEALEGFQTRIQLSSLGILRETEFKRFHIMSDEHFNSMMRIKKLGHADSWMIEWLVPDDESVKDFTQTHDEAITCDNKDEESKGNDTQEAETSVESIEVENERKMIEAQRVIDDDLEDDEIPEVEVVDNHLPLAVYFDDLMSSVHMNSRQKSFLREKISMQKKMHVNQVSIVRDVWRLDIHQRWGLYHYWLSEYMALLQAEIPVLQNEYTQLCAELRETNDHEKCLVLQQATIVGMTTTRAASEREVLQRVKPKIIIVEEAAEVLESHIITSLHSSCQQLILIGDHQQLRPKPHVYQLATRFHLDVSMFERLVKNGFPFEKLKQQHRMRPEISSLMRDHFYPELEDNESVYSYKDVKGVEKNVFFLDHTNGEAHVGETMSHYNLHEVDFTVALCKHLLNQGYEPKQITILTAYTGQLLKFKEKMDKATFEGVTVASVDNYQGEENDIILLSFVRSSQNGKIGFLNIANRVCVSLSRAKQGLYCMGNFTLYSDKCALWKGIYGDLKANCRVGDTLMLQCYNHPHNKTEVARAADFRKVPDGGCGIPCDTLLDCGHVCNKLCHPADQLHQNYTCPYPCTKKCERDHACSDICGNKCPPCRTTMDKKLPCGHVCRMKCSRDPTSVKCNVMVEKKKLPCQHLHTLPCHLDVDRFDCLTIVQRHLQCGHTKFEKCSEHGMCSVIVSKDLPCGHIQMMKCSLTEQPDIVCTEIVLKILPCSHTARLQCNVEPDKFRCLKVVKKTRPSCGHVVTEECSAESDCSDTVCKSLPCGHQKDVECCTEVHKVFCKEQCEKDLACGHRCSRMCGDTCVTECNVLVARSDWPCGHKVTARCSDKPDSCKVRCQTQLECGHTCKGTCGKCMGGRYHVPCRETCDRTLVCGHKCTLSCVSPCLPCSKSCENFCDHVKCNHPCGEACPPCTKQCNWRCPHHKCRTLCCETCSRPTCDEPCLKKLMKCGHSCSGLCGEICPELCRICDKVKLKETSFGSQDTEESRYIQLEECGHVFEVTGLDRHMGLNQPETTNTLISLKKCPKCNTPLRHSRRYGIVMKLAKRHVLHVKRKLEAKKMQVVAGKCDIKQRMKSTLTRRNLGPLGIGEQAIGRWLRIHQEIRMEHEPAIMSRLQLIRTLMELQTTLSEGTKDTQLTGESRRDKSSRNARHSVWKEHIDETQEQIAELGNALLRDATSFSYQEAHDLHREMCRTMYMVLLLNRVVKIKGGRGIQLFEESIKALGRKVSLRNECLEKIRPILNEYYKATRSKLLDIIPEFHPRREMTFDRDRWCRCPKGHTFMIQEDEYSLLKIDCEICLRFRARESPLRAFQESPPRHTSATPATEDQGAKGLREGEFRRLAIAVPSCGIRRGPGQMPYDNKRSVKNSPMNPNDPRSFNRGSGKVESSSQGCTSTGKSKGSRNERLSTLPTASSKPQASAVSKEGSKQKPSTRRNKSASTGKTHVQGTADTRSADVASTTINRRAGQHSHGACAKDQTWGSKMNRAPMSKPVGAPQTGPTGFQDTTKTRGASRGTPRKSDSTPKNKGKPQEKMTPSQGCAKTPKSTGAGATADQGQHGTSHRRNRGRGRGGGGGNSQVDDQYSRPGRSGDAQERSGTGEQDSSTSRRRNRRKKYNENE